MQALVGEAFSDWIGAVLGWLNQPFFRSGEIQVSPATVINLIVYVAVVTLIARGIRRLLSRRVFPRLKLEVGISYALANIAFYLVVSVGLIVGIQTAGLNLSSLTVLVGALGVGIGFGLQEIASNFVSGLILLIERPIQVGDRIQIDQLHGRVTKISMRATEVRTNEDIVVIVPNRDFVSLRVVNWSRGGNSIRIPVPIGVAYGSDVEKVRTALLEAAAAVPVVLESPPPSVRLTGFGDSSIDFELLGWTKEMLHQRGEFISRVNFAIHASLKKHGIEIPFPQRDLHVRSTVPFPLAGSAAE